MKNAQPNEDQDNANNEFPTRSDAQIWGLIGASVAVPVLFIVKHFSGDGEGIVAAASSFTMVVSVRTFWRLRKQIWYWLIIAFLVAIHILLLLVVPWPNSSIPAPALLPVGLVDFAVVYGCIKLGEKIMMGSSKDKSGNAQLP
jgi:hypothetical protein